MASRLFRPQWSYSRIPGDKGVSSGLLSTNTLPKLSDVVSSKRFRWMTSAIAASLLLILAFQNANQIAAIRSSPFRHDVVDWSRFAYVQYVTDSHYLCNSVMFFERLDHVKSKADRVMMYPSTMLDPQAKDGDTVDAKLLIRARDVYGVKLVPVTVQHRESTDSTWADSFTKLLAFNQTQYERVLSLDSDSTLLQNVDELFLLPPAPVAMPLAYWLYPEKDILSSQIMLVTPSAAEFERVKANIDSARKDEYDMEIVNTLYRDSAMILPHRPYDLLTRTFGGDHMAEYLGNDKEEFDSVAVYNEAKFLHFSDWPVHKPWLHSPPELVQAHQPKCVVKNGVQDCTTRDLWLGFYTDFRSRRKVSMSIQAHENIGQKD
ncbi:glucose N-acetyltransferase [Colletotrichum sublineola]|uniref:Putative glucose N-acetyltransferase n=1 Tax=Colletotrichum sublineola TaxID=1173701 RepID=A0A066WZJ5_COLSU|nr:glucose N-acetyltransferase [Colletotrichum sublineola]KDN62117.1 putative glucose N-acetyltransferase [Colletotrichum sublineola]